MSLYGALPERVRRKLTVSSHDECWLWAGCVTNHYGTVGWQGKPLRPHRLVWQLLRGEIPEGLECDHLCRNKLCCNPDHIELVTHLENMRRRPADLIAIARKAATYNRVKTHCPNGHEYDYIDPRGHRGCRKCRREAVAASFRRKRS